MTCSLCFLSVALLKTSMPGQARETVIGPFKVSLYSSQEALVSSRQMHRKVSVPLSDGLPCLPCLTGSPKVLIVGQGGGIEAISTKGSLLWSVKLPYFYNPGHLVTTDKEVIYDVGPISVGSWTNENDLAKESRKTIRIVASNQEGKMLWSLPWLDVGTPLASCGIARFISIRPNRPQPSEWSLELHSSSKGTLMDSWSIPMQQVSARSEMGSLSDALRSTNLVWNRGKRELSVYEARDISTLDLRPRSDGFRAKVRITRGTVTLSILAPVSRTITLTSKRNGKGPRVLASLVFHGHIKSSTKAVG